MKKGLIWDAVLLLGCVLISLGVGLLAGIGAGLIAAGACMIVIAAIVEVFGNDTEEP